MPREYQDYRETIEQLNRLYPDRELLTIPDCDADYRVQIQGHGEETLPIQECPYQQGDAGPVPLRTGEIIGLEEYL